MPSPDFLEQLHAHLQAQSHPKPHPAVSPAPSLCPERGQPLVKPQEPLAPDESILSLHLRSLLLSAALLGACAAILWALQ